MKTKIISKILLTLALVFVLGSAITHVHGGTQASFRFSNRPSGSAIPGGYHPYREYIRIHGSIDDVTRGKIGTFVLSVNPKILLATTFVNFSVSGTAIPGVDYTPLVSPSLHRTIRLRSNPGQDVARSPRISRPPGVQRCGNSGTRPGICRGRT